MSLNHIKFDIRMQEGDEVKSHEVVVFTSDEGWEMSEDEAREEAIYWAKDLPGELVSAEPSDNSGAAMMGLTGWSWTIQPALDGNHCGYEPDELGLLKSLVGLEQEIWVEDDGHLREGLRDQVSDGIGHIIEAIVALDEAGAAIPTLELQA